MIPTLHIELTAPPQDRWHLPDPLIEQARTILASYLTDLGGIGQFGSMVKFYAATFLEPAYQAEIRALASIVDRPEEEVLIGNLYYDTVKFIFGCTAFAVDTLNGPLHARNLDWWTVNNMLRDYTVITRYAGGDHGEFSTIGWPGYIGALSGIAPGRFAITLNAVLSKETPNMAKPISLFIRTVLERASDFYEAVAMLEREPIASDCLLLVSGTRAGEMVVIERTPTRHATRYPEGGYIAVTNDYRAINTEEGDSGSELQSTSCGRYDTACAHLSSTLPHTADAALAILSDPSVRMKITVQQMVLQASTGQIDVRLP